MDVIFDGDNKASEMGYPTYRDMMLDLAIIHRHPWNGSRSTSVVFARVDFGRWLADCECGAANYVSRTDKDFYYCPSCGNEITDGAARVVVFPDNYEEIELELLKRLVIPRAGVAGDVNRALNSTGPISRSWFPGETIETLKRQRDIVEGNI